MPSFSGAAPISLTERLDTLPLRRFHWRLICVSGLGWMFDAMDVALIAFVLPVLAKEWSLSSLRVGWSASMSLIGMLFGAILSGTLADRYGRKPVMIGTLAFFSVSTALCSIAWNFPSLLFFRFLTGLGLGGELPIAASLVSEFSPSKHRGRLVILLDTFWSFGWTLAAGLAFFFLPRFGWKSVFLIGSLPVLYVFYLRRSMPESPRFLMQAGKYEDAIAVVRTVERHCGVDPAPLDLDVACRTERGGFLDLWHGPFARQTLVLWILWFVLGYTYFGIYSWLPTLLVSSGNSILKSSGYTLVIALAQAPGFASAALFIDRFGRIATITVYRLLLAVACFFFAYHSSSPGQILLWGSLISFFGMGSWGIAYTYTTEIYPTYLRALGSGWATAFARVGGIIAPIAIGWILGTSGSQKLVFLHITAMTLLGAVALLFLGRETRCKTLEQIQAQR